MSRNYKFHNQRVYILCFAVVGWLVFLQENEYKITFRKFRILSQKKGMEIHAWYQ